MKRLIIEKILFLVSLGVFAQSPNPKLFETFGGSGVDIVQEIEFLNNGDRIVCGSFRNDSIDLDPGIGEFSFPNRGEKDGFVSVFHPNGQFKSGFTIGNRYNDEVLCIEKSNSGTYFIGGFFADSLKGFLPNPDSVYALANSNSGDAFIAELDSNHHMIWLFTFGGSRRDYIVDMDFDKNGDLYVSASIQSLGLDVDPGMDTVLINGNLSGDILILKLNANKEFVWAKKIGTNSTENALSIKRDNESGLFIAGFFNQNINFNLLSGGIGTLSNSGFSDVFVIKLDTAGNYIWVRDFGGAGTDTGQDMDIDKQGNIYVVGGYRFFNSTLSFIWKLDSLANTVWFNNFTNSPDTRFSTLAIAPNNHVFAGGHFTQSIDVNPGTFTNLLLSNGSYDCFVVEIDENGDYVDALQFGGPGGDRMKDLKFSFQNELFIGGYFRDSVSGTDSSGTQNYFSNGEEDIFISGIQYCFENIIQVDIQACEPMMSFSGNSIWDTDGLYFDTLSNIHGCDSILEVNFSLSHDSISIQQISCDSFFWSLTGLSYYSSGIFNDTLQNNNGCDSIVYLDLSIVPKDSTFFSTTTCDSYIWPENNQLYNQSGRYFANKQNSLGCDSIIILDLILNQSDSVNFTQNSCDSFTWSLNGQTYDSSGVYNYTLMNSLGCDSTIYLDLTIETGDSSYFSQSACGSYLWQLNGQNYDSSGIYNIILSNINGCDSIVYLELTISPIYNDTVNTISCFNFQDGQGNLLTQSGLYSYVYTSIKGCDSMEYIDLEILTVDTTVLLVGSQLQSIAQNAQFQWLDCNASFNSISGETDSIFNVIQSGNYAVEILQNGCLDTSFCQQVNINGINQWNSKMINVYPNPAKTMLNITFKKSSFLIGKRLVISDFNGQSLKYYLITDRNMIFPLNDFSDGIYILSIPGTTFKSKVSIIK